MYLCITPKLIILEVLKSGLHLQWSEENRTRFSISMDMIKKDQKSYTQALIIHFQIYFKVLLLRNMLKCWSKKKKTQEESDIFFFLPFTTDHKEKTNNFFGNRNLHPIDCAYNDFIIYSDKNHLFLPHHVGPGNKN